MNDSDTLDKLEEFIKEYNTMMKHRQHHQFTMRHSIMMDEDMQHIMDDDEDMQPDFLQSEDSDSSEKSDESDSSKTVNTLYTEKIDRFLNNPMDINIHLYNKSSHFIDNMEEFIDNKSY